MTDNKSKKSVNDILSETPVTGSHTSTFDPSSALSVTPNKTTQKRPNASRGQGFKIVKRGKRDSSPVVAAHDSAVHDVADLTLSAESVAISQNQEYLRSYAEAKARLQPVLDEQIAEINRAVWGAMGNVSDEELKEITEAKSEEAFLAFELECSDITQQFLSGNL